MGLLIIRDKAINVDLMEVIMRIKSVLHNGKLATIKKSGDRIKVNCPYHKNGLESKPSCNVYCGDSDTVPYGTFHCFTCSDSGSFSKFVGHCFDQDEYFGERWLLENYEYNILNNSGITLEPIKITHKLSNNPIDEKILDGLDRFHPYMKKRKLSDEIISKFELRYDPKTKSVIFPIRDEHGKLVGISKRNVNYKRFDLSHFNNKPVYLLYNIIKENIKEVYVCESQINALYMWSLGYPAIALLGTGTKYQYDLLNKSGIRFYHLVFDGDEAGDKGINRFFENINNTAVVDVVEIPRGKDVNDLSPEEVRKVVYKPQ